MDPPDHTKLVDQQFALEWIQNHVGAVPVQSASSRLMQISLDSQIWRRPFESDSVGRVVWSVVLFCLLYHLFIFI